MNPLSLNKNKSTIFILPMVLEDTKSEDIITDGFINTYIADFERPEFDDFVLLIRKDNMINTESLDMVYDSEDDLVYVFKVPEKYLEDYFKIIAGEYSSTSESYKKASLAFWDMDEKSTLYKILYGVKKGKELKELLPSFSLSEEIYKMGTF